MTEITVGDVSKFGMVFDKDTIKVLKGKDFLEYWCVLKEKAEKFDKLVKIKPSKLLLEKMDEKRACEQKLEAIKTWRKSLSEETWKLVKISGCGLCDELDKILEGEALQNIGESPT